MATPKGKKDDGAATGVSTPVDVWEAMNQSLHEKCLYPTIRVKEARATGSGTIIYCQERTEKDEDGELGWSTYALTNHHVVSGAIRVEKKFDPQRGKDITRDYRELVQIEAFSYKNRSTITARTTADAEIMAYHDKRDVALLRLKTNQNFPYVANILPRETAREIHIFDKLFIVGCGLGVPPFPTDGMLTGKDVQIDYYPYWQTSAPSIFGNSGGAVFRAETLEYMGIPSRISVSGNMFSSSAVTHIGYFCPPNEIHKFLEDQGFHFLLGTKGHTEQGDLDALADKKKKEESGEDD